MADVSRQVLCKPHLWHVQEQGEGPTLLLIHGAGGASQSWRALFPLLARTHHVVAIDLPGQGFTQIGARGRCSLEFMAQDIAALVSKEGWSPSAIVGHSAGCALALELSRSGISGRVIGINGALSNFKGVAEWLFPIMAKAMAVNPLSARMIAATSNARSIHRLITGTGSHLDSEGERLYLRLARDKGHLDATLSMMAQWSLDKLMQRLPKISAPVDFIVSDGDLAVPPSSSIDAAKLIPTASVHHIPKFGHLVHEEAPREVLRLLEDILD